MTETQQCPATKLPYPDAVEPVRCAHRLAHTGPHKGYAPSRDVITWESR